MSYELFVEPQVHGARRDLPGNVRQRIPRAIEELAQQWVWVLGLYRRPPSNPALLTAFARWIRHPSRTKWIRDTSIPS